MRYALLLLVILAMPVWAKNGPMTCGAIASASIQGGSGYAPGEHPFIGLAGGSGTGAVANITVEQDGTIKNISTTSGGTRYKQGDVLTAPGLTPGSGFSLTVQSVIDLLPQGADKREADNGQCGPS